MGTFTAFFDPDGGAFIDADPSWPTSGLAGGHEVEAIGVEPDGNDVLDSVILYANSWAMAGATRAGSGCGFTPTRRFTTSISSSS